MKTAVKDANIIFDLFDVNLLDEFFNLNFDVYITDFVLNELKFSLLRNDITYTFLGDVLGGLPDDTSCYTNGHVDYDKLKEKDFFKNGLQRLITANQKKIKVAIMCSESKPEECHRTKLIGEELIKIGINLNHITRTKNKQKELIIKDQKDVMLIVAPNGTVNLFGEELSFDSRKKYKEDAL